MAKARLRRGIELVKLANRIEALKIQEDEEEDSAPGTADVPARAGEAAAQAILDPAAPSSQGRGLDTEKTATASASLGGSSSSSSNSGAVSGTDPNKKGRLSRAARSAIFREIVLAKVREQKALEERQKLEKAATK